MAKGKPLGPYAYRKTIVKSDEHDHEYFGYGRLLAMATRGLNKIIREFRINPPGLRKIPRAEFKTLAKTYENLEAERRKNRPNLPQDQQTRKRRYWEPFSA